VVAVWRRAVVGEVKFLPRCDSYVSSRCFYCLFYFFGVVAQALLKTAGKAVVTNNEGIPHGD
jgi:hypothetical protein